MTDCDLCRMLDLMPQRRDVPPQLRRFRAGDLRFGRVELKAYECVGCASLWRWYTMDGWRRYEFAAEPRTGQVPSFNESFA